MHNGRYHIQDFMLSVVDTQPRDSIDYCIAQYILTHVDDLDRVSLGQLAAQCGVSKSSVSRFCRKIGLEDYLDLQLMCRNYRYDPKSKFHFPHEGVGTEAFIDAGIANLTQLKNALIQEDIQAIVRDIHDFPQVAAMGLMQSGNIAFSLQHDLFACKRFIDCTQSIVLQREYLQQATAETLLLVFSARGRFFDSVMRGIVFDPDNTPRIYLITTQTECSPDFVHKTISLAPHADFTNSVLLSQTYASLISLNYYETYCK